MTQRGTLLTRLPQTHRAFMQLVLRTADGGDGWRNISPALIPITESMVREHPELYEFVLEQRRVRLTQRALVLMDYV